MFGRLLALISALMAVNVSPQGITKDGLLLGHRDSVFSHVLNEMRYLNIYLPPDYSVDSAKNYKAVYLLDGGMDEDFIHVAGLVQYFNFPWIPCQPRLILIGIENTNRKRDFTYSVSGYEFLAEMGYDTTVNPGYGGSGNFISFIEKELQPYVNQKYPTGFYPALVGQSLGGLLATEIMFRKRYLFHDYIIISPSLWWDNNSLLTSPQKGSPVVDSRWPISKVYLAVGSEGKDMITYASQLHKMIQKLQPVKTSILVFDYLKNYDHATIGHQAIVNAFEFLYGDKD